ncbi:MAG: response regulator [Gammaproteobacteria bacterium]|nr:response regulator [Gammaproteobacteria bacterium]
MNIVLADPDLEDRARIGEQLSSAGHEVTMVGDGVSAIAAVRKSFCSLVVTEWQLGDMTGLDLAQMIKASAKTRGTRVMMVSDASAAPRFSEALDSGVDDCVVKPCRPDELLARASLVLRRPSVLPIDDALTVGPITLDRPAHKVSVGDAELKLSPVEYRLIRFFLENPGRVFDRQQLLEQVWQRRNGIGVRTVDVHVRRLRASLEPHQCAHLLQTVRGFGYRFG